MSSFLLNRQKLIFFQEHFSYKIFFHADTSVLYINFGIHEKHYKATTSHPKPNVRHPVKRVA
jgi:hypothetical protein